MMAAGLLDAQPSQHARSPSIIATVLNEASNIEALVQALAQQRPAPREIVIVDGGSTDGTWERLERAAQHLPALRVIRDESCNLRASPGPIARGRNIAIMAAGGDVLLCADAGCTYAPDWAERLAAPILAAEAEYALGGSCLCLPTATLWDVAAAPFLGVKLAMNEPTRSCTARSMAFTREAWERAGRFPEHIFIGEDVAFDRIMRQSSRVAFVSGAQAIYAPHLGWGEALRQIGSYAEADGIAGLRAARLMRNANRCVAEIAAVLLLHWSIYPLLLVLAMEVYFALRLDWRQIRRYSPITIAARISFSLLVPWVVAVQQMLGALRKRSRPNRQNA